MESIDPDQFEDVNPQPLDLAKAVLSIGPLREGPRSDGPVEFWTWTGTHFAYSGDVVADRMAGMLGNRYKPSYVKPAKAVLSNLLRQQGAVPVDLSGPRHPDVINFRNGVLHWRTGQHSPSSTDYAFAYVIPHDYSDRPAPTTRFDRFLVETVGAEQVSFVWEFLGYLLLTGNPLAKLLLCYGSTSRNGKSTLINLMLTMLGQANASTLPLNRLGAQFGTHELLGKLANVCADIDGTTFDTGTLKGLLGGDVVRAERKYRSSVSFVPYAVPVFSTNTLPTTKDKSNGFMNKCLVLPFPNHFPDDRQDHTLADKLTAEVPGIITKAVEALRVLMARGAFLQTPAMVTARDAYAERNNSVLAFLRARCEPQDGGAVQHKVIYQTYVTWCAETWDKPVSPGQFTEAMAQQGYRMTKPQNKVTFHEIRFAPKLSLAPVG